MAADVYDDDEEDSGVGGSVLAGRSSSSLESHIDPLLQK